MPLYILLITYKDHPHIENVHKLIVYAKNKDAARKKMLNVFDNNFSSIFEGSQEEGAAPMKRLCTEGCHDFYTSYDERYQAKLKNIPKGDLKAVVRERIEKGRIIECGPMIHVSWPESL